MATTPLGEAYSSIAGSGVGLSVMNAGYIILAVIFTCIVVGIVLYIVINLLKFNKKVVIFEKVGKDFIPVVKSRGMFKRLTQAGDETFYIQKIKKTVPYPNIQTGKNTYWFFKREDGELINFSLEDLDEASRKVNAHFLDKDVRYARASLQSMLKERYDPISFWNQYGGFIVNMVALSIVLVFLWLISKEVISSMATAQQSMELAKEVNAQVGQILASLDNVCNGGSGLLPAG